MGADNTDGVPEEDVHKSRNDMTGSAEAVSIWMFIPILTIAEIVSWTFQPLNRLLVSWTDQLFTDTDAISLNMYAIITGGTRGLGLDAAEDLANNGYTHLILTYNSNTERAEQSRRALEEKYGISVFLVKGDLVFPQTVDAIFDCVQKNFGNKLNALVHNAGAAVGVTSRAESDAAKRAAASYKKTIGSGEFDDFATYDYFQDIYPKCFIRMVEKAVKIMEDGKGYILAVSTYGCNCTQTVKPGYAITTQAKGGMEIMVS